MFVGTDIAARVSWSRSTALLAPRMRAVTRCASIATCRAVCHTRSFLKLDTPNPSPRAAPYGHRLPARNHRMPHCRLLAGNGKRETGSGKREAGNGKREAG